MSEIRRPFLVWAGHTPLTDQAHSGGAVTLGWSGGSSVAVTIGVPVRAGDVLVAKGPTLPAAEPTSVLSCSDSAGNPWTPHRGPSDGDLPGDPSRSSVVWTTTAAADAEALTVSLSSSVYWWAAGAAVEVWRDGILGAVSFGAVGAATTSVASYEITTGEDGSAVTLWQYDNWRDDPTLPELNVGYVTAAGPGTGTLTVRNAWSQHYSWHHADTGPAGTYAVGMASPAWQNWTGAAVEIRAVREPDPTAAATLPRLHVPDEDAPNPPRTRVLAWEADGAGGFVLAHPDVPVDGISWREGLNGPAEIALEVEAERPGMPRFTRWRTVVGVEIAGSLRAAGVVTEVDTDGPALSVEAVGLTDYPRGLPWTDSPVSRYAHEAGSDVGDLISLVWDTIQGHPGGDLGVSVDRVETGTRLGVLTEEVQDPEGNVTTSAVDEPWRMDRTETHDLGSVLEDLVAEAGLETAERVSWRPDYSGPAVRLEIAERIGRRRPDIWAHVGTTVIPVPATSAEDGDYASGVLVVGAGQGEDRIVSHREVARPERLRRVYVYQAQDVDRQEAADRAAAHVLERLRPTAGAVHEITLLESPASASVWTVALGDELYLSGDLGAGGPADRWVRVIGTDQDWAALDRRVLEVVEV